MNPEQIKQIEFIKDYLRKGFDRHRILQEFTTLYKTGVKTFDNRLKIAREELKQEIVTINERANDIVNDKAKESALKTISVAQRISILAEIAFDKKNSSNADKTKAIAELNKMDGSYAPTDFNIGGNLNISKRAIIKFSNGKRDNNTD
jgi:hypothetical protein